MLGATKPEEIILTDFEEKIYKQTVEALGYERLLIIHKKHYKEFLISIEEIKKEAIEEYKLSIK